MLLFLKLSLLKKRIQKICTHDNSKFLDPNKYLFYFFNRFRLNKPPKKSYKSSITTPKKYDNHPYHPNIWSNPPPGCYNAYGIAKREFCYCGFYVER